jgi:hypothetical protein
VSEVTGRSAALVLLHRPPRCPCRSRLGGGRSARGVGVRVSSGSLIERHAAVAGRLADKDLPSILDCKAVQDPAVPVRRGEGHSLQPGTGTWSAFGTPPHPIWVLAPAAHRPNPLGVTA